MNTELKDKIAGFLGQGLSTSVVAGATGVTPGYISQLLVDESFRNKVTELRTQALQKFSTIDQNYEDMELKLQERLRRVLPLIVKPHDVLEAIKTINSTKRRGTTDLATEATSATVIEIKMPQTILQNFTKTTIVQHNEINQIIQAGEQSLITAQPDHVRELSRRIENDTGRKESLPAKSLRKITLGTKELSVESLE